jgi:Uma2 family endonuclease
MPVQKSIVLENIDWTTYSQLLHAFGRYPGIRLTYDRGQLEIMSPILRHDRDSRFLMRLIEALTEELDLPLLPGGSTTLRRRVHQQGGEPDECFWIANAARMAGRQRIDLRRDPPPDLAVEVDVSRSSLDRMGIFATLGIPEIWRLQGNKLTFHVRSADGKYRRAARSQSFPQISPTDLMPFIQAARKDGDQNPLLRRFRKWVQGK